MLARLLQASWEMFVRSIVLLAENAEQTNAIAAGFADALTGDETVSLEGELGAGKTHFVRALARAMGVQAHVTSPTFVLQKAYSTACHSVRMLQHYDVYRMADYDELLDIGFEDLPDNAVALVEWGDRFVSSFSEPLIRIEFAIRSAEARTLTITANNAAVIQKIADAVESVGITILKRS